MIRFEYQPTLRDYMALQRHAFFRGLGIHKIPIVVIYVTIFLLNTFGWHPTTRPLTIQQVCNENWFLLVLPGAVILGLLIVYRASRKKWNESKQSRSAREYVIDEKGIQINGDGFSAFREWQIIEEVEFKEGCFFLKTGSTTFIYFSSSVVFDKKAFVDLVRSKVKITKNLEKA